MSRLTYYSLTSLTINLPNASVLGVCGSELAGLAASPNQQFRPFSHIRMDICLAEERQSLDCRFHPTFPIHILEIALGAHRME